MSDIVTREFRSPKSKLARARRHLADLDGVLATYAASVKAERCIEPLQPEDGNLYARGQRILAHRQQIAEDAVSRALEPYRLVYAHRLYLNIPPLEDVNAIVADIIQNLRQALDHAACACARSSGRSDKGTYFTLRSAPTADEDLARSAAQFKEQSRKLPVSIRQLIDAAEPGGGLLYEMHMLGLADKHRSITECACYAGAQLQHVRAGPNWVAAGLGEDEWDPVAHRLNYALSGSPEETDYGFNFTVAFRLSGSGVLSTKPLLIALTELADLVDGVIGQMETEMVGLSAYGDT